MDPQVSSKQPLPAPTSLARAKTIRWIGGIVRPHGCKHGGKPMRVAAWITSAGSLLGAAIVEGHGPTVLAALLTELLASTNADERPNELVVWPSARAAFAGLEYPPVVVERNNFLTVVIDDEVEFGHIPGRLSVRKG